MSFECCTEIVRDYCIRYNIECMESVQQSKEQFILNFGLGLGIFIGFIVLLIIALVWISDYRDKKNKSGGGK